MPSHRGYQKKCSLKWAWLLTKKTKTPQTPGSHSQDTFLAGDSRSTPLQSPAAQDNQLNSHARGVVTIADVDPQLDKRMLGHR